MKPYIATVLLIISLAIGNLQHIVAQELTGTELLEKAISYHDPSHQWPTFDGAFQVTMTTPEGSPRVSEIKINLLEEKFHLVQNRDSVTTRYTINKGKCLTSLTDSISGKRTPCETAALYKNYYTYLYGLPMKLKDDGTNVSEVVERKTFKGKEYLVLKASYDEAVGSDIWYFYFDPETYAMEIYQFFKTEDGSMQKDSGEYILLSEEKTIDGIKVPKIRAWYYNKDDKYLGTDSLN